MKQGILILAAGLLVGCSESKNEEPKAQAEIKVDVEGARKDMEKAFDKAGDELKKGAAEVKDAFQDAGEKVKEKAEEARERLAGEEKKIEVEVKTK